MGIKNFIYRCKYHYGQYLNLQVPVDISLELSSHCQARCSYCYHADKNPPFIKQHMSPHIAMKIINQGADFGVNSIKFNFRGESTLHPEYHTFLRLAWYRAKGSTYQDRITNSNFGFKKNRDAILDALCHQTKVKVSLDSFTKSVYEEQRPGIPHELVLKNIDDFYKHRNRKNAELIIQAVRTTLNADEELEKLINGRWPGSSVSIREMVPGRTENDVEHLETTKRDIENRIPCEQAFSRLIFDASGNGQFCCPDIKGKLHAGNIITDNIYEMFNSPRAKTLRENLKSGVAFLNDPCKTCSSKESYKGYKRTWKS